MIEPSEMRARQAPSPIDHISYYSVYYLIKMYLITVLLQPTIAHRPIAVSVSSPAFDAAFQPRCREMPMRLQMRLMSHVGSLAAMMTRRR